MYIYIYVCVRGLLRRVGLWVEGHLNNESRETNTYGAFRVETCRPRPLAEQLGLFVAFP